MSYKAPRINGSGFLISRTRVLPVGGPRRWDTVGVDPTPTSGLGTISIPDYTLWSSGDISSFYNVILNAVSQLDQEIQANVPNVGDGAQLRSDFTAFKNQFATQWATYHDSWPAGASATPVTTARDAAGRYNRFEERYTQITGRAAAPSGISTVPVQQSEHTFLGQPLWVWGVAGAGGLVALGLVAWAISSVGRTAAAFSPAALLHNPPRKRRRRRSRR